MRHFSKWTGVVLAALLWVGASAQAANEPWQGNPEYPFVVAHDNVVVYQDNASLKFLQFTPEGVMWRIDLVTVLPVTDPNSIARVDRIWYRKMNNEPLDRVLSNSKKMPLGADSISPIPTRTIYCCAKVFLPAGIWCTAIRIRFRAPCWTINKGERITKSE